MRYVLYANKLWAAVTAIAGVLVADNLLPSNIALPVSVGIGAVGAGLTYAVRNGDKPYDPPADADALGLGPSDYVQDGS